MCWQYLISINTWQFFSYKLIAFSYFNIIYINIFFFFIILILLNVFQRDLFKNNLNLSPFNNIKQIIPFIYTFNFILVLIKWIIEIFFIKQWLWFLSIRTVDSQIILLYFDCFSQGIFLNNLGYSLLVLCYISSFLSLFYLGDRDLFNKGTNISYFSFFLICTSVMVNSTNLLIVFCCFEFIFLPTIYFAYTLGYFKKVDKAIFFLLGWTLFGSFLILIVFLYIYNIYYTLDYKLLSLKTFSDLELIFIYITLFIGFGIKIPLFPFHFWLTKVHVEAPAGFSMFLSGFLVKTAFYCFYFIHSLFYNNYVKYICIAWIIFCIIEASVKMWVQIDIKKLVAFATIQEMNILFLLTFFYPYTANTIIITFIMMHGLLSILMFFLVDQIQKKTQTRNIIQLSGLGTNFFSLHWYIWIMLIIFLGIPGTIKFIIEWHIGLILINSFGFFGFFGFFFLIFFGSIGFIRSWLIILYGNIHPNLKNLSNLTLYFKDHIFAIILIIFLFILNFFFFFLV